MTVELSGHIRADGSRKQEPEEGEGAGEGLSQGPTQLKALAEIADPFKINDSGEKLSSKKCFGKCGGPPK